jgi:hypothetical protein
MKMSEFFPDAFKVEHNKSFEVQNCHWITFGTEYHSTFGQDDAIAHAVLNHDHLELENKRLREFVTKVSELDAEMFRFETQDGDEDYIEYVCTGIVDEAIELLGKIEGDEYE